MADHSIMSALMDVIAERKARPQAGKSYVAGLMNGGVAKIGAKIVEEAAEVVEAGDEPGEAGRRTPRQGSRRPGLPRHGSARLPRLEVATGGR